MTKIRILIADDHAVLRAGLRMLINAQPDMDVVGEAADGAEALARAQETDPDVVTMDLTMPGTNSLQVIERLRQECPRTRVLVLTMHDDPAYLRAALAAGSAGYVVKTAVDSELLTAIRAVHQGRTFVDLHLGESLRHSTLGDVTGRDGIPPGLLSQREKEVLGLLAQGYTNQQIADQLGLSVKTIETYRTRLGDKLGLRDRAALTRYAVQMGLLSPDRLRP